MSGRTIDFSMVDLFAGCGGLSLGMEQAGFTPVFVNELNPDAMATHLANLQAFGWSPVNESNTLHCHDAHELKGERLEDLVSELTALGLRFPSLEEARRGQGTSSLDLVAGGPPCQGYSGIGHRRSYAVNKEDLPSNQLYNRMAEIIERLRPRIFLFENVKGLLSASWTPGGKKVWKSVLDRFRQISDYEVRWSLVRASDYGVPQNRPRVLLVGIRKDVLASTSLVSADAHKENALDCQFLPKGDSIAPGIAKLLGDLIDPSYYPGKSETVEYNGFAHPELHEEFRRRPDGSEVAALTDHEYSKHSPRIVAKFQHMLDHGEIPEWAKTKKFAQRVLPPDWEDGKGPTITATSLPDDYVHFTQPRILTVREWARLQTFPDWYEFKGKRTTGGLRRAGNPREGVFEREVPKYTQIGNAIPPRLARRLGEHFRKILKEARLATEDDVSRPCGGLHDIAA